MTAKPLPRPRQVTFSGWSIVAGSVLTILFAFQRVAALGSLEAQEAAADFISTPPGDGLGLSVAEVQLAIRVMCLVAGGTAAATAILGWQVMQPSRSARVVLSVLAPVLFVAGLTSGGLFSALVAAGVTMLWLQPARDYFDGKAPVRDPVAAQQVAGGGVGGPSGATPYPPVTAPPPSGAAWDLPPPGPASERIDSSGATMTEVSLRSPNPFGAPAANAPGGPRRPGTVTAAGFVAIAASAITFVTVVGSLIYVTSNRASFVADMAEQLSGKAAYEDISAETVTDFAIGLFVVLALWCVVAIVLAVATLRGSNGARIALILSGALSALISLLGVLVIVPIVLTIASIATIVLLLTGSSRDWFAARSRVP